MNEPLIGKYPDATGHFGAFGGRYVGETLMCALEELDAVPREWFHFVHLCDAEPEIPATTEGLIFTGREGRVCPGEGGIDLAAILDRIPVVPYSLEIPNLARVKEIVTRLPDAERTLQLLAWLHARREAQTPA